MKLKVIFLITILFLITSGLFADTVILKSGEKLEGNISDVNNDSITIDVYGVKMPYFMSDIEEINGKKVNIETSQAPKNEMVVEETKSVIVQEDPVNGISQQSVSNVVTNTSRTDEYSQASEQTDRYKEVSALANPASSLNRSASLGITMGVILFFLVIFIVFYIYGAICLYIIAQKTSVEPAWLAWIPIANLYLMCKIASLSPLWILGFFLGFIPVIGGLISMCVAGYIWYKIGIVRNAKPQWIGILVAVPVVGLIVIGYLAFSE